MQSDGYNWQGVLEFLHKQYQNQTLNEDIWFLQKKALKEQIKELESRVSTLESINSDLINRNRMLQYCLRQLKGQKNQGKQQQPLAEIKMPQRRAKPNKNHINKQFREDFRILQSLGIKNLIENIQKDLQVKGMNEGPSIQEKKAGKQEKQSSLHTIKSSEYKQIGPLNPTQAHQDGVRDLSFVPEKDILVSVSEDCTMKLWNIKKGSQFNCMGTIRQHSGPIFTLTQSANHIFSGGMQGIIRAWNFNNIADKKDINKKCCVGSWSNSEDDRLEPIWQLLYSYEHKMLFSTSSEISIKSYGLAEEANDVKGMYKKSYSLENKQQILKGDEQIPTSICIHNGFLIAGYVTSHTLAHFDLETGKVANQIKLTGIGQVSTNKIISHPHMLMGAFEDKTVRFFDKSKMINSFQAHQDSVTSIATTANLNQFFTCGHDGYVKLWDLRKLEPISSFYSHSKKYDESIHCITTSTNYKVASGGADAVVKIYSSS